MGGCHQRRAIFARIEDAPGNVQIAIGIRQLVNHRIRHSTGTAEKAQIAGFRGHGAEDLLESRLILKAHWPQKHVLAGVERHLKGRIAHEAASLRSVSRLARPGSAKD